MATKQEMLRDFQTKSSKELSDKYHIEVNEADKTRKLQGKELEDRISKIIKPPMF